MTAFSPGASPPPVLMAIRLKVFVVVFILFGQKWFGVPNLPGILGNGAVAGEPARCGNVQNHLACPCRLVGIQFPQPLMGLGVTGEVGQMPVVVAVLHQRIEDGREDAGFVLAEMIAGNQVERGARLRFVVIVPARMIPAATALDRVNPRTLSLWT